ncbi:MAG: cytochrome c biogenesis protein ResB, partial [Acidobacteria bacterium]|nr:cytochrome c biogenesis protein ResB [Acidobacteriota bacterium]MCA1639838.1 cytochrome c biogenesis protein ResB [Acidobacteriota bacterium]
GFGLIGSLLFVFFISHRRVWTLIEQKTANDFEIVLGGNTNRNEQGFEEKFKKLVQRLEARC